MRPAEARQISMARSSAQSECGELSTGTKTSLYGMTPPSAVMGSLNEFRIAGLLYKTHQSGRRANTPAHQHPSILAHFVREKLIRSRSHFALAPVPLANRPKLAARDMDSRETHVKDPSQGLLGRRNHLWRGLLGREATSWRAVSSSARTHGRADLQRSDRTAARRILPPRPVDVLLGGSRRAVREGCIRFFRQSCLAISALV